MSTPNPDLMLTNPYDHLLNSSDNPFDHKIQFDITGEDKGLLKSIHPTKGTIQLVVSNLIHNLCEELRELKVYGYRHDGDLILETLVGRRGLTSQQAEILRRTTLSTDPEVSTRLCERVGGAAVCERSSNDATQQRDKTSGTVRGKQTNRGKSGSKTPKKQESDKSESNN